MHKQRVWMTFDLGVRGDYDGLYQWLDKKNAVECGNGVATFEYEFSEEAISSYDSMFRELKDDLKESIDDVEPKGRIYALTLVNYEGNNHPAGSFLFGKRKVSPWDGFANNGDSKPDV